MRIFNAFMSPIYFAAFENTATGSGSYVVNAGDERPITIGSNVAQTDVLDVNMTKTVDKTQAVENDKLTYTVTITNNSSIPISDVVLKDVVDNNTTYDASNTIPYVTLSNGYNIGTIPSKTSAPNNVYTLTFTATINNNVRGTVTNTADLVSYTYQDAAGITYNGAPLQATASTVVQDIDVETIKTVTPTNAKIGDTVLYTITVFNRSSTPITNVIVKDSSADLSYLTISNLRVNDGAIITPQPSLASGVNVGTIGAGTSSTVKFNGTVLQTVPNEVNNTALTTYSYMNGPTLVTIPDIPTNTATLSIVKPAITIEKYANQSILINDGTLKQVQYSVFIRNTGNTPIDNVVLTDILPSGMTYQPNSTYISGQGPANDSPEPITGGIYIGTVAANSVVPVLFNVDVRL